MGLTPKTTEASINHGNWVQKAEYKNRRGCS